MSIFKNLRGTSETEFRIGLTGPTIYTGTTDPTVTPPTAIDALSAGDLYIRTGTDEVWSYDGTNWIMRIANGDDATLGTVLFGDGASGTPSLGFASDPDTGFYTPVPGTIGIATAGTARGSISDTGVVWTVPVLFPSGADTAPSIGFSSDADTGFYLPGDGIIGFATAGVERGSINASGVTLNVPLLAQDGAVGSPALSFASDTNTGFYSGGVDILGVATGGVNRLTVNTTALTSTLPVVVPDGAVGTPSYSFAGDTTTGFYSPGVGQVAIAIGGANRITIDDTDLTLATFLSLPAGSVANPSLTFTGDTDTGFYRIGAGNIGVASDGALVVDFSSSAITTTKPLLGTDGAVGTPSYTFSGDTDTGFYRIGAGNIGVASEGALVVNFSSSAITVAQPVLGTDGAVGTPSYTFTGDTDTGFYRIGAGNIGVASEGALVVDFSSSAITTTKPLLGTDGAVGAPALTFSGDTDTGFYRIGAGNIGVASEGVLVANFSSSAITVAQPVVAPLGAVGTPSYTFTGDTDTGIFSPGANQLTIATAGAAAIEVDASGNTTVQNLAVGGALQTAKGTDLTIATGAITAVKNYHRVDTEAAAATDDLDTINGGLDGMRLVLTSVDAARDVVVKHATGNIRLSAATDFTLANATDTIELIYDGAVWLELSRSTNA